MLTVSPLEGRIECHAPHYHLEIGSEGWRLSWKEQALNFLWDLKARGECEVSNFPRHASLWGPGMRVSVPVLWPSGLEGQIDFSLYAGKPGFILSGRVNPPGRDVSLDTLPLFCWRPEAGRACDWRLLVNSGHQGYSGSLRLDHRCQELPLSQDVTVLNNHKAALAFGNVSFRRTNIFFKRSPDDRGEVSLHALLAYGNMRLPADQPLDLESLLILPGLDPLALLETYAGDVVALVKPSFSPSHLGLYNQWYANWTPTSDHGSADLTLHGAVKLRTSPLYLYGIAALGSGVWHNQAAFGEEEPWPGLFPLGIKALKDRLESLGIAFMHGGFWGKASACATIFQQHPEWMARNAQGQPAQVAAESWGACPHPYYIPDITLHEVQAWIRSQWERIRQASSGLYWLDFYGTGTGIDLENARPTSLQFADRELAYPFETDRLMTGIIRQVVGDEGIIAVYTSPTFNLIGLIDRARMALDVGPIDPPGSQAPAEDGAGNPMIRFNVDQRWEHLQAVARNLAAAYFCHNRFWVNDPDPAMVGLLDRPETLEEARVRVMIAALSGGFITVGEALERIPPGRLELLKTILPPYGVAARPLDLLDADVPQVYSLPVQTRWESWLVLTFVNWSKHNQQFSLPFQDLGLSTPQHLFEFWEQRYLGIAEQVVRVELPPKCCRVFGIRPVHTHPWLLTTDLHVTQGGVELEEVAWDPESLALSGSVYRPEGAGGVLIYVPAPFRIQETWTGVAEAGLESINPQVARLSVRFPGVPVSWKIWFTRE